MAPFNEAAEDRDPKRRKPHTKSRNGCVDCRKRRCSEEKPSCRACVRRRVRCQYRDEPSLLPSPSSIQDGNTPTSSPSTHDTNQHSAHDSSSLFLGYRTIPIGCGSQNSSHPSFCIHDMALLHHWTVSTSHEIYKNSEISTFWQVVVPQIGFEHSFVMNGILGLAALHLAHLNPSEKHRHLVDAASHHSKALQGFQHALNSSDGQNSNALFIWSTLNLVYVFGISGRLSDDLENDSSRMNRNDRILGVEWIPMIRGIEAVVHPTHDAIESGPLGQLMNVGNWFELDPDSNPDAADQYFVRLRNSWEHSPDAETYEEALRVVRKCSFFITQFKDMDAETLNKWGYNRDWSGPLLFIVFAPKPYFDLLHQRQPPALILFAFFGALFHYQNDCWFLGGWGRNIVEVVDDILGGYWRSWIEWPLEVVGLR
ncbi:hypothetical protein NM208_g6533 [Fusarium decemcellulare]|uniref:Uncharacterized protein n=1 Tax=Fusarium decemcellulare TaxID=57161 RepID=A0ACC1SCK2_9HYPO|nr:hypothetical protein NM208_g6533 [Fusarium decemcellulare]